MECPFCKTNVKQWNEPCKAHLIVTKNAKDNHFHTHGELNNKELMRELINAATLEANIVNHDQKLDRKELVFHNRQRIGDILVMTAGIRDFKNVFPKTRISVVTTASHIWDNNPYVDCTLIPTPENTIKIGPSKLTNSSNRLDWHFTNAYRMSIEGALNVHIPQGESRPDIWLTEEEYNAPRVTEKPYWIIIVGGEKGWGCKMYPFERWQEFVNQNQDILFYQLGAKEDQFPILKGDNVVDYVGKTQDKNTGIRDLFKLFLNAEGSIGLVSFQMHLSGAFKKPCIVVAGAREPVSFTRYPGQQYLATDGCLPCAVTACWHCNIDACSDLVINNEEKIPKCVDMIMPMDLTVALNGYYVGGRLKKNTVSEKPKFKNIVKTQKIFVPAIVMKEEIKKETKYGIPFGNTYLEPEDWQFMEKVIDKYNIKSVIEFGSGLSTLCMIDKGLRVVSFETDKDWIETIKQKNATCDIRLWDGKTTDISASERFNMAFVDGPTGGENREFSTKIASELANYIIIHDANRKYERLWQEKYLLNKFQGIVRGGRRIHFWGKELKDEPIVPFICRKDISQTDDASGIAIRDKISKSTKMPTLVGTASTAKKYIKFVFNGRGEGGAERSIVWMMNKLVEMGHRVTYHTPNQQPCGTFRNIGSKDIRVEDCNSLNEACDILVLYSNDWVWNFDKNEVCDIFSNLNADRKVFCVNYRIDKIGLIEWTKGWDFYLFLNSSLEKTLLERCPNAKTKVFAPPTNLTKFFEIKPDYSNGLRLIRHSSQGDIKYPKTFNEIIEQILRLRENVTIRLMPAPSFLSNFDSRVFSHQRNVPAVDEFLKLGNCFWYILPEKFSEGGPKVIMEAQASGLAVIADNHSGMKDRVVDKTGYLVNSLEEHLNIIRNVSSKELEEYGKNAREYARVAYDPMNWIKNILGED